MTIAVELLGDEGLIARLEAIPSRMHDGIARAVIRLGLELQRRAQQRLSGEVLKLRTGALRSSVNLTVDDTPTSVAASVGIPPDSYGRYHEFGVDHPWLIEARRTKALRLEIGGEVFFRRRVAHSSLPEHSFLRTALQDIAPLVEEELGAAVAKAIR